MVSCKLLFLRRLRIASGWSLASYRWSHEFGSRSLHVGFVIDETEPLWFFSEFISFFYTEISFHGFSTLISFILSASVMERQAWLAGILAVHRPSILELLRTLSFDPACFGHGLRRVFIHGTIISINCLGPPVWYSG